MAVQKIYIDYDFNQNQILNARQHPLTTAQRISLGNTLTETAESILVFDIEVLNVLSKEQAKADFVKMQKDQMEKLNKYKQELAKMKADTADIKKK